MKKKFLAGLLSLAMMLTLLPVGAFAAEGGPSIALKFYADGAKANAVTTKDDSERDTLILDINPGTISNDDKYLAAISYPSEAQHEYTAEEGVTVGESNAANYELITGELSKAGQYYISLNPWTGGKQQYKGIVAGEGYTVSLLKKTTAESADTYTLVESSSVTFTLKEVTIDFGEGAVPTAIIQQHEDKGNEYFYRVDGTAAKIYALTDVPETDSADALTALQKLISFADGSDYADATKGTWAFTAETNTFAWTAKTAGPTELSTDNVSLSATTAVLTEGSAALPTVTVDVTGAVKDTSYTVTWRDSEGNAVTGDTVSAAGTYTVTVAAKTDDTVVSGSVDLTFTVTNPDGPQLDDLDLNGIFPAALHDTRVDTSDANAVQDADLYAADSYKADAAADGLNVDVKFAAADLKQHQNGDSPASLGYWVGVAIPAPAEGVNAYQRKYKNADGTDNVSAAELEDIAAGKKGYTLYLNAANPKTTAFSLSFGNLSDGTYTQVTKEYTFILDFKAVSLYTTATATLPQGETTATVDSTVAENLVKDVISAATTENSGDATEASKPTVTIDAKEATGATAVTIPAEAVTALTGAAAAEVADLTVKVDLPEASVTLPASALKTEGTAAAMTISVAPNTSVVEGNDTLTQDDKVEAHDIEVKKGTEPVAVAEPVTVSVKTTFTAQDADGLKVIYFPDTGKPSVISAAVTIDNTMATFTVPHLSTYALMKSETAAKLDLDEALTFKYQIGSDTAVTLTGTSATVGADVETIKIIVEGTVKAVTVNGAAYTDGGHAVQLTAGANEIKVNVGGQEYTLTFTRESAVVPPASNPAFTFKPAKDMTAAERKEYYCEASGGMLTINNLDPAKTYMLTMDNGLASGKNIPRTAMKVTPNADGSFTTGCQWFVKIIVFTMVDSDGDMSLDNVVKKNDSTYFMTSLNVGTQVGSNPN